MIEKNLNDILDFIIEFIEKNSDNVDILKVKKLYNDLFLLKNTKINLTQLETINREVENLETTNNYFMELSNYFDPIYTYFKKEIHIDDVKKIREENRKKKENK